MATDHQLHANPKWMTWAGWIASVLTALMLVFSAVLKLVKPAPVVDEFTRLQWPDSVILAIGIVELTCALLYLIPQTAMLGAILVTGYLGGAIATHVRMQEGFIGPAVFGVLVWLGLYLRDRRVRALIPVRTKSS